MTHQQYIIQRKLKMLELGHTLGNISGVCRELGVSRQHYYDIKKAIEEEGLEGLIEKSRNNPRLGNRLGLAIEQRVLDYSLQYPTHGQVRVVNELRKEGINISTGGVRGIWQRHNLLGRSLRLKRLEKWAAENTGVLTESQVKALEEAKEKNEAYGAIESPHPGFLVAQDTSYMGFIKGVGRIYQQTAIDTHSNVGFAKIYSEKISLTAADLLNDRVLPFFDEHGISVLRVLTDNGPEFRGRHDIHAYELFLRLNDIEHTYTKVRHPQTNGAVERLHQTIQDEFYRVTFRKKLYHTLEEVQVDLDVFMEHYNKERTNQGRYCQGRTPFQTFQDSLELYNQYVYEEADDKDVA